MRKHKRTCLEKLYSVPCKTEVWIDYASIFFSFIHFQESGVHENQVFVNSTVGYIYTLIPSPV